MPPTHQKRWLPPCLQYLGAAFFIWHLWRKGRSPGGVRLRWVVSSLP